MTAADDDARMLDASMDAVVVADSRGKILRWNRAAEQIFGMPAADVIGQELGATIIPAHLRSAHRAGLARFADGAPPAIPGGRTETVGQRSDGTLFPVELTITRLVDGAGEVTFVGFLRDISERHRMLAELRDSRERLLTVSDDARRKVERDLHDGAQQQLVALAIALGAARRKVDDPSGCADLLDHSVGILASAIDELRELARGVHTAVLTERGLAAAVAQLAGRSPIDVFITIDPFGRLPKLVETSLYYLVAEALTNATKYGAHRVGVDIRLVSDGLLPAVLGRITDDGPGGADPTLGTGLAGMAERLMVLGGRVDIDSRLESGTAIEFSVPLPATSPRELAPSGT